MSESEGANNASERKPDVSIPIVRNAEDKTGDEIKASGKAEGTGEANAGNPGKPSWFQRYMERKFPNAEPHDRWTLVFTGVIALSTVLYTLVAGFTLIQVVSSKTDTEKIIEAMQDQAEASGDMADAAEEISNAADSFSQTSDRIEEETERAVTELKRTANDSEKAIQRSQRQFEFEQRPYITIKGMEFHALDSSTLKSSASPMTAGQPVVANTHFENTGKSTAYNVIARAHVLLAHQLSMFKFEPAESGHLGSQIGAGEPQFMSAGSVKDTFKEFFDVNDLISWDGKEDVFAFGRITYEDSFGNKYCIPYVATPLNNGAIMHPRDIGGNP